MTWLQKNLDKVFGFIMASIVGGVIGFFSAIFAIKEELNDLEKRVLVQERLSESVLGQDGDNIKNLESSVRGLDVVVHSNLMPLASGLEDLSSNLSEIDDRIILLEAQSSLLISQSQIFLRLQLSGEN
ncbi:MAG: hypothetical protein QNJ44_05205 [Rhodobacter sp.]|nr:hypothetical protein [Rhodobacter sp.]